jgi:PUA-domain protein
MPQKYRRYSLKPKEAKLDLNRVSEKLKINLETVVGTKSNVEAAETDFGQILLINGKPLLFKVGDNVLPTLFFTDVLVLLPKVVVDMGAVPHVCNGADIMAPGIVRTEGEFRKGDLVVIVDEKHGKPLALGEVLFDSEDLSHIEKGSVVKNAHFVSDKYWNSAKAFVG